VFGQWKGRAVEVLDGRTIGEEVDWHLQKDDNDVSCLQDWKAVGGGTYRERCDR
jgi:hypothetical protein